MRHLYELFEPVLVSHNQSIYTTMKLDKSTGSRKVIDQVTNWFRVYNDGTVDRTWTGPKEALLLMKQVPPHGTVRDISINNIPSLRIYFPQTQGENSLPILLHFHGGGFCMSHATWYMYYQFYSRLASAIPAIVVSPFLPLAPEHRLPAALHTSFDSLLFLRSVARDEANETELFDYADFSRVFLIGDSSGGNLVHQVAAKAGMDSAALLPVKLAGAIPIHPGFVRATRSTSEMDKWRESPLLSLEMVDKCLGYGLPEGATKDHPITCPMGEEAEPLEGLDLPPFLVAVADGDLIRDTNLEYCEAMKKAGKDVQVVLSEGVGHSFYLDKLAVDGDAVTGQRTEELLTAIQDFVQRH